MSVDTHTSGFAATDLVDHQPVVALELEFAEAEALHSWLLRAEADGVTSLDDTLVSAALAALSRAVDDVRVAVNIRRELASAGLDCAAMSDDQVRELGRRLSQAVSASARD